MEKFLKVEISMKLLDKDIRFKLTKGLVKPET